MTGGVSPLTGVVGSLAAAGETRAGTGDGSGGRSGADVGS
jgi:hypothetical protein